MVLASRFISCTRKSSFLPTASPEDNMVFICPKWLLNRTVSSAMATLSAKIAASVRSLCSSIFTSPNISWRRAKSFSLYSFSVCGERSSIFSTIERIVSALDRTSSSSFFPSASRMAIKEAKAWSRTTFTAFHTFSSSSGALWTEKMSEYRDRVLTEISSWILYRSANSLSAFTYPSAKSWFTSTCTSPSSNVSTET